MVLSTHRYNMVMCIATATPEFVQQAGLPGAAPSEDHMIGGSFDSRKCCNGVTVSTFRTLSPPGQFL